MKNTKELRVIELFAGVGSQTQALKNMGIPHTVAAISDNDRWADKSYKALHGSSAPNLGDITKIEELTAADLWTYSFPCTDVSVAGRRLGLYGTRSGLLWEVERLLCKARENRALPRYLILENVKNLVGKTFRTDFDKWLNFLTSLGYRNFWKVVNARDYIPQNRERVFCVSIWGDRGTYEFPTPPTRTSTLKDLLEPEVDPRYYLKFGAVGGMLKYKFKHNRDKVQTKDCCRALTARDFHDPVCVPTGSLDSAVWDLLLRMTDPEKGGKTPLLTEPIIVASRGRTPDNTSDRSAGSLTYQRFEPNTGGVCNTLMGVQKDNLVCTFGSGKDILTLQDIFDGLKIRRLTEREYWRLMGWKDAEIDLVKAAGVPKTAMYRQAGNGIVVPVLEAIFANLFK